MYRIDGRKGLAGAIDQVEGYYIVSHNTTRESHIPESYIQAAFPIDVNKTKSGS